MLLFARYLQIPSKQKSICYLLFGGGYLGKGTTFWVTKSVSKWNILVTNKCVFNVTCYYYIAYMFITSATFLWGTCFHCLWTCALYYLYVALFHYVLPSSVGKHWFTFYPLLFTPHVSYFPAVYTFFSLGQIIIKLARANGDRLMK